MACRPRRPSTGWARSPLGEPSVIVAVSAAHRSEAFAGAREAIDRIKAEAPIWKRELAADGAAQWADGAVPSPPAAPRAESTTAADASSEPTPDSA